MTRRPAIIPAGSWPRQMSAALSAGYCGESTIESFLEYVKAGDYPAPRINQGRRKFWLKDDLDKAMAPDTDELSDAAAVL